MRRSLIYNYTIRFVILIFGFGNLYAQWYESGSNHVYTLDRVSIGQDLTNGDRQVNIYGSKTSGYQVGSYIVSEFPSNNGAFIGKAIARLGDCVSYTHSGMGVGITAYTSDVTRIRNTSTYGSLIGGGSFHANITDPIPSGYESNACYYIFGARAVLNGTIETYPTNGVVSAFWAKDYIQGTKTWAGYFDGKSYFSDSVGIGTKNIGGYHLAVGGKIRAAEVKVEELPWSDFVFDNDYRLMKLSDIEKYIIENKNLPGIPTSQEIQQNGINLGEMNAKLLQKIEELTLYIIDQNKRIEELESSLRSDKESFR